jgi:hypothetical protein
VDELQWSLFNTVYAIGTGVAVGVSSDAVKHAGIAAWGKLKSVLGWKTDPKPEDVRTLVTKALAEQPQLATQIETVLNDYRQQLGGVSIGTINAKNVIAGENNTFNGPTTFN